jgi:hypothetical protein
MSIAPVLVPYQESMGRAFLPKLLEIVRSDLYKAMCSMLHLVTKEKFDTTYQRMKATYANNNGIINYVKKWWTGNNNKWKKLWLRWNRMF